MRYIFEPNDIKAGALFRILPVETRMIVRQHISSAESENKRQYAILDLETGKVTSSWMTQEKLAEYLTGNLAKPLSRSEVFVSDTN